MTRIVTENRPDGRFSLSMAKGNGTEPLGFPREFKLDLALHELDQDAALVASMLIFRSKLWQKEIVEPKSSLSLSERLYEAGYPSERMPMLHRSGTETDYSQLRQNTLVVMPIGCDKSELLVTGPGRQINAFPLDVALWTGRIFGPSHLYFGTNLLLVEQMSDTNEIALRVAIGVLVSNDLRIGKIVIPEVGVDLSDHELSAVRALTSSIGLEVEFRMKKEESAQ